MGPRGSASLNAKKLRLEVGPLAAVKLPSGSATAYRDKCCAGAAQIVTSRIGSPAFSVSGRVRSKLTRSPDGMVKVFPRRIDLENTEKLKTFEATQVVESLSELKDFIARRGSDLKVA